MKEVRNIEPAPLFKIIKSLVNQLEAMEAMTERGKKDIPLETSLFTR
jgi:hypothetical protein